MGQESRKGQESNKVQEARREKEGGEEEGGERRRAGWVRTEVEEHGNLLRRARRTENRMLI